MYLQQLYGSGLDGIDEWREMWNDEVLPYLRSLRPLAGPGTRAEQRSDGTLIRAVPAPSAAAVPPVDDYDSYFKLTLKRSGANNATTYTVRIADGATDGASLATVNSYRGYVVNPYEEVLTVGDDRLFFLDYTPAEYADYRLVRAATLEIDSVGRDENDELVLPDGSQDNHCYMQLGRVLWKGGAPETVQDFKNGVADMRWYVRCF